MPYTVAKQYVKKRTESAAGWITDFGHTNFKDFNRLPDAREYAKRLCMDIRNEKTETVYISETGKRTIESWIWKNGHPTCLESSV